MRYLSPILVLSAAVLVLLLTLFSGLQAETDPSVVPEHVREIMNQTSERERR